MFIMRHWLAGILRLNNCTGLEKLHGLSDLSNLEELHIEYCSSLQTLDGIENLSNLKKVIAANCTSLKNIDAYGKMVCKSEWKEGIDLRNCTGLQAGWQKAVWGKDECEAFRQEIRESGR